MHPLLEQLHAGYAEVLQALPAQAIEMHPADDSARWNARQIVEHLILTYQSSSAVFRDRLAKGRPSQSRPSAWQRVQQIFVCRFGFIPDGRTAPRDVVPSASAGEPLDGNDLCARLYAGLRSMDELLVLCERQFGERKFATHQVIGPLSAGQWRKFHVAHGRHHLKQLRRLHAEVST
jgi:hypothetical protein